MERDLMTAVKTQNRGSTGRLFDLSMRERWNGMESNLNANKRIIYCDFVSVGGPKLIHQAMESTVFTTLSLKKYYTKTLH